MRSNSKEYLEEYSNGQDVWLKFLIDKLLLSNGKLEDDTIEEAYTLLLNPKELEDDAIINSNTEFETKSKNFHIEELMHISGVNALKENQTIKFNKEVTILYGQNGSGKSGYFKVLNEIAGGNEEKKILPNIYDEIEKPIDIRIKASTSSRENVWQNENRGIPPFNKIAVFDSSYVDGLLKQRASQEALVEPLGLHLFASLIQYIDEVKEKVSNNITKKQSEKPIIDYAIFSEDIKNVFLQNEITEDIKKYIEQNYEFSDGEKTVKLEKALQLLKSTNLDTEIKLLNEKITKTSKLIDVINEKSSVVNNLNNQVREIIAEYIESKKNTKEYQKKIEILNQISLIETDEWKDFIISAKEYENLLEDNEVCIYCRNPLNDNSKKIIGAYSEYLNNSIIQKNEEIENKMNTLINTIIRENILEIDTIIESDYKTLKFDVTLNDWNEKLNNISNLLYSSLENKKLEVAEKNNIAFENIINQLTDYSANITKDLTKLTASRETKNEEIKVKESELNLLLEKQSIYKQKDNIKLWLKIDDEIVNLEKIKSKITTTSISTLSKTAHNELLTENLKVSFKSELDKLGHTNLNVSLIEAGTSKGVANTKLEICKNNKITDILSEGEQKAVAIAMFLAELSFKEEPYPIVFDDPVTSLDNNVMKSFVERVLELNNQIIIFTHNAYFLSLIETADNGHICKNMDNGCSKNKGKHIYLYEIKEVSDVSKGLIISKDADNSETDLEIAKECLNNKNRGYEVQAAIHIRLAIEKLIDEKILLNITPQRYTSKNNRIDFNKLKQLGNNQTLIDILDECYDRISGGKNHDGLESRENPLQERELKDILDKIDAVVNPIVSK